MVGHEALGGQLGPVAVAARQAVAADAELADHADRRIIACDRAYGSLVFAIGRPIGTGPSPGVDHASTVDQIVVSVGP